MPNLRKARFKVRLEGTATKMFIVQYNPNKLSFTKKPKVADINIPGLDTPLKQFVRGEAETLTVELFFDSTEDGTGDKAKSVVDQTDKFYSLVKINPKTHAPPICEFMWSYNFPGARMVFEEQQRAKFVGIVTEIKQDFTLFGPTGTPLRAKLTLTMSEYKTQDDQIKQLNLQSPDHTQSYVLERGDTLAAVAFKSLENPGQWRHVADSNDIEDPRRLEPGQTLVIPPLS